MVEEIENQASREPSACVATLINRRLKILRPSTNTSAVKACRFHAVMHCVENIRATLMQVRTPAQESMAPPATAADPPQPVAAIGLLPAPTLGAPTGPHCLKQQDPLLLLLGPIRHIIYFFLYLFYFWSWGANYTFIFIDSPRNEDSN